MDPEKTLGRLTDELFQSQWHYSFWVCIFQRIPTKEQLSITIVHDATRRPLAQLEGMFS